MRRKSRYLDKKVVSTKHERKYKAPHCNSVNSLGVSVYVSPHVTTWDEKGHTHREHNSRKEDEIWMKLSKFEISGGKVLLEI